MQMIGCTQKLLQKLPLASDPEIEVPPEVCWHANLIRIDHHDCVLFTHDMTLFSLIVLGASNADFKHFSEMFGQALFKAMRHFDFSQAQIETMLDSSREIRVSKTKSRSVLGSMNDMKQMIEHTVRLHGGLANRGMAELYQLLNHTPFKAIGYNYPEEKMRALLNGVKT